MLPYLPPTPSIPSWAPLLQCDALQARLITSPSHHSWGPSVLSIAQGLVFVLQRAGWPGAGPSPGNLHSLRQPSSTGDDVQVRLVFRASSSCFHISKTSVYLSS